MRQPLGILEDANLNKLQIRGNEESIVGAIVPRMGLCSIG